jgi:hypothetical protein
MSLTDPDVWLPSQSGGAKKKRLSALTANEVKFHRSTDYMNHQVHADRERYQQLARELLFNEREEEPHE